MEFKVYKMNECDTVISHLSKEETNEWYKKEYGYEPEEQKVNDVEELPLTDGYWLESCLEDAQEILLKISKNQEVKFKEMNGCIWVWNTFEELIDGLKGKEYKEPFIACSTEY